MKNNGESPRLPRQAQEKAIFFLHPILKERIWGGNRLVTEFPYGKPGGKLPASGIGECWAVSAHQHGDCLVTQDGGAQPSGMTLSQLYARRRELFGNLAAQDFPLLVKVIDAREDLSIQVHPDDVYARENEGGSLGKTECWYIMDCPEDARLVIGHHARTRQELREMIGQGRYGELIREIPVRKGDLIQIAPGTVHAVKAGFLILETQQSSDVTYRVYDYGRLEDGAPRKLHVCQSMEVIRVPDDTGDQAVRHCAGLPANRKNLLVECDYYKVWKLTVEREAAIVQDEPFLILSVLEGSGAVDGRPVAKGSHLLLPYGYGEVSFAGEMELILSTAAGQGVPAGR
ncbi:MAG: class I mannose-6-phosphate isomerase [Clostridium sp.]|jgi:mannose-6-phosphate isomerase class I|nr:class I mannose-6-phosphate isomerase [Clostridium sp.]